MLVLAAWAFLVAGVVVAAQSAGSPTSDNLTLPGSGSTQATDVLDDKLPKQANGTVPIALRSDGGGLDRGSDRNAVERTVSSLQDNDQVRKAISPLSAAGEAQLSRNGRIGFISLSLIPSPSELSEDEAESVIAAADPVRKAGIEVSAGGYLGQKVSKPSTETSERIGIAAAIIILLLALGTVVAMAMPIAVAVVGVATGLSVIGLLGHIVDVPSVAATLGR